MIDADTAEGKPRAAIDRDPATSEWGLWPTAHHREMGDVRVDGVPVHFSDTDWSITRGGPCLGEHNDLVYGELLGLSDVERAASERWIDSVSTRSA